MDDFRKVLGDELSSLEPPPPALGDLVGAATRDGRRARRARSGAAVGGAAVALASVGVLLVTLSGAGRTASVPAAAGSPSVANSPTLPAAPLPSPSPSPVPSQSAQAPPTTPSPAPTTRPSTPPTATVSNGGQVPATGPGLLEALLGLLPPGATGHYTAGLAPDLGVQTYLTTAAGTGMIRLHVSTHAVQPSCGGSTQCSTDSYGHTVAVSRLADNCIQSLSVYVYRGNGTGVQVDVASCLAWDGTNNPPGVLALTVDQAIAIAGNPAIGPTLAAATVKAGAAKFPTLPPLN